LVRPLPEPVLFLDECLGSTDVPEALRALGATVELLHEHFPAHTPDESWLREVGRRGWVVLTKDQRLRRRKAEHAALLQSGVAAFVLTSGNLTGQETAEAFVHAWPRIRKLLRDHAPPLIATVSRSGQVKLTSGSPRRGGEGPNS